MVLQRLKSFVYDLILWGVKVKNTPIEKKTLLLVRTSHIGDYILWRKMFAYIRKSRRFEGYKITLVGNKSWKGLFEHFDADTVDETIWLDMHRFKKDMRYRYSALKKVSRSGFEIVINTIFSRCKREDDAFVMACKKAYKIGHESDDTNIFFYEKGYDKNLYDELFKDERTYLFELIRDVHFTEFLINEQLPANITPRFLPEEQKMPSYWNEQDYFVVFPGSSSPKKMWKPEYFAAVAQFVAERYGLKVVIGGGPGDKEYVAGFLQYYKGAVIDLCGKTSLVEFAQVLQDAKMLISIDTGSVHVAAAVDCPVFAIYNGSHYGRYNPYPEYISKKMFGIYPDSIDEQINKGKLSAELILPVSIDFNSIKPEKVCKKITEVLG